MKGLGRPKAQKPKSRVIGSGSRPAPKPTSKSTHNKPIDEDIDDLEYELIDDELFYDDDDEFFNDDDGFYDDDL